MPRISTQHYKSERLQFKSEVNVNANGIFTTTLPQDVVESMTRVGIEMDSNRANNKGYFQAPSLQELNEKVQEVADKFSSKELIEEKVILKYSLDTTCAYCKTRDGTIVPNGYYAVGIDGDYQWSHGTIETHAAARKPYGFTCYVKPVQIRRWRFLDGTIETEELQSHNGDFDYDETLKWLDALCGISPGGVLREIDYVPEIGLFFKSIILYIINLNEKLKTVFGSDIEISLPAIGNIKMLTHHNEDNAIGE